MKKFEIWIDESGKFENDKETVKNGHEPSCVGGAVVEKGNISDTRLANRFPEEVHCKNITCDEQIEHFKFVENIGTLRNFIIKNLEQIDLQDDSHLYFTMLAEGIIKVIKQLRAENGRVHVDIFIATRVREYRDQSLEEFKKKEQERDIENLKMYLKLAGYRDGDICDDDWSIWADRPKFNPKLQVADIVCNTYLTRNTKLKKYKEITDEIFGNSDKTLLFSFEQDPQVSAFYDMMSKGELGSAIFAISCCKDEREISNAMSILKKRLRNYPLDLLALQLEYIIMKLQHMINNVSNKNTHEVILRIISNLNKYIVKELVEMNNKAIDEKRIEFQFDLELLELTIFTHKGDLNKEKEKIDACEKLIPQMTDTWKNMDKILKLQNRKLVHRMNAYEHEEAYLEFLEKKEKMKDIVDFMSVVGEKEIKYTEYAKYLGTGVQLLQYLIREKKDYYDEAKELSKEAIDAFGDIVSKNRQYQYRILIETEGGNYDEALRYLVKALGEDGMLEDKKIVEKIGEDIYLTMHLIRLIAEGMNNGWKHAEELFECVTQEGKIKGILEQGVTKVHPYEIISWKYATCWAIRGNVNAAMKYYNKAVENAFEGNDYTLWMIWYAILLEKYAMSIKYNSKNLDEVKREVKKISKKLQASDMPENMKIMYGELDFDELDWKYFYDKSRINAY